jgi:hypothetical protein
MLHICLVDNIHIILSVGKLYCHITVTDMLLGQIPICCRYATDICHITVTDTCHITVTTVNKIHGLVTRRKYSSLSMFV